MDNLLFVLQRLTAAILGPFVLIHLVVILYAVRGGLTAADILARTQGSVWWIGFYGLFVVAVAIHGPIGVRRILMEWFRMNATVVNVLCALLAALMLVMGMRAVVAVGGL